MIKRGTGFALVFVALAGLAIGYLVGRAGESGVGAQEVSPTKARARDFYVPNSEDLAADEMRIIACGTGMPTPRPAQAAACFLVELGNGDKFIFDMGEGSLERLWALQIPPAYLDKVFIGHLHGAICRTIEIDLREMLGERALPPAIEPKNGVLM